MASQIQAQVTECRNQLNSLRYKFNNLKEQHKMSAATPHIQFEETFDSLAKIKSSMREITLKVMERKK